MAPLAAIFGCAGPQLAAAERDFFARADPTGFILFARNVESPAQLRALVARCANPSAVRMRRSWWIRRAGGSSA